MWVSYTFFSTRLSATIRIAGKGWDRPSRGIAPPQVLEAELSTTFQQNQYRLSQNSNQIDCRKWHSSAGNYIRPFIVAVVTYLHVRYSTSPHAADARALRFTLTGAIIFAAPVPINIRKQEREIHTLGVNGWQKDTDWVSSFEQTSQCKKTAKSVPNVSQNNELYISRLFWLFSLPSWITPEIKSCKSYVHKSTSFVPRPRQTYISDKLFSTKVETFWKTASKIVKKFFKIVKKAAFFAPPPPPPKIHPSTERRKHWERWHAFHIAGPGHDHKFWIFQICR